MIASSDPLARQDGREEARGLAPPSAAVPVPVPLRTGTGVKKKGASPQQYVDRPSGEPARHQACRSGVSAVVV
jgi:hypothetical protein